MDYKTAKGWLRAEEREVLAIIARGQKRGNTIVNIGVEYGASLVCFMANMSVDILGIDIDLSKVEHEEEIVERCGLVEADSAVYLNSISDDGWTPIDVLFIDGDHSYEGVKRDIGYIKYVIKGGTIIFHDCYDYDDPTIIHRICPGVNQAVDEWLLNNTGKYEEYPSVGTMRIFKKEGPGWTW